MKKLVWLSSQPFLETHGTNWSRDSHFDICEDSLGNNRNLSQLPNSKPISQKLVCAAKWRAWVSDCHSELLCVVAESFARAVKHRWITWWNVDKAMMHVCFVDPKICSMVGKSYYPWAVSAPFRDHYRVLLCAHLGKCCRWPFFLGWAKRVVDLSIYLSVYVAVDVITYVRFIYLSVYLYRICFQELKNPSWKRKSDRKRFHV